MNSWNKYSQKFTFGIPTNILLVGDQSKVRLFEIVGTQSEFAYFPNTFEMVDANIIPQSNLHSNAKRLGLTNNYGL